METAITFLIMLAGILLHFLKKVMELRTAGDKVTLVKYWTRKPYATAFSVLSAMVVFALVHNLPEFSKLSALGLGFMCDSVAGLLGQRGIGRLST